MPPSEIAVAILNARPTTRGLAVLDAALGPSDDGWHQLLPVGPFKARDGRPFDVPGGHWQLDKSIATTLINRAKALGQDILIDYDHQTLNVEKTGKEAPAAGWYNGDEIEWREGQGLFIKPRWTERAAALVAAKEYRFLSAVFPYDAQGRPLELRMTAITNDPGVVGMQALAALSALPASSLMPIQPGQLATSIKEKSMNEHLIALLGKLGIQPGADGQFTAEQGTAALAALDTLQASAKKAPELEAALAAERTSLAALRAQTTSVQQGAQVDLAQYVPVATYNALVTQVAALTAQVDITDAATLIKEARTAGKVVAAEEEYLTAYAAQKGVAALKALLEPRPAIVALTASQTAAVTLPEKKGDAVLSAEDKYAADQLGISHEDFAKAKA
ncbi:phage protease [Aeromonas dhakensis]|uniref:phage protease n=1 Tax=Aeromonas dhakensis TaxID=196024 RepID=UPI0020B1FC05|nr:phage protease [Aeromonas dhakensis]CAD7506665.1 Mu-like prophage FluMu I protein [Aeromonas dhakensis]CAD7510271.1 Mu-like prophage FluMu I protein [Aeromonas dhakensis]CAD7520484.1 Mu-like prophage FluMu I protein [Aeromonas dhakensis]CAD7520510.1 Mu-like prophage FluMu I protein [Aeromonas dhakensis]CAD7525202.1 Mu-like prophage FluMu I protein [Aeromonas dhakensis]